MYKFLYYFSLVYLAIAAVCCLAAWIVVFCDLKHFKEQRKIGGYFFTGKKNFSFFSKPMQEMQERPNQNIMERKLFAR